MKMYILIRNTVPDKMAPVIAAHAALACFRKFEHDNDMQLWINGIFKKVVCKVSDQEFEQAKLHEKHILLTESALDNTEVALVFCPRPEYGKAFKFFRMWTPEAPAV
jgi:peptidyl-tRNA hydrolase